MLEHFVEVSHAMPPEQGQRYLAEMKRITPGITKRSKNPCLVRRANRMDTNDADAHDRADMERLIAGHDPALDDLAAPRCAGFSLPCRMLANEDDANDLAQETFFRIYRAQGELPDKVKDFPPGFTPSPRTPARNHFRWRTRHPNVSLDAEMDTPGQSLGNVLPSAALQPSETALATERAAAVRAAVSRLPEDLREAIVLCEWEERSMAEAAAIRDTSPKAIESRLYRARQILRERLKQWL
jgi:RNA polymerase sigma-70 factor (ECF subfamily)